MRTGVRVLWFLRMADPKESILVTVNLRIKSLSLARSTLRLRQCSLVGCPPGEERPVSEK